MEPMKRAIHLARRAIGTTSPNPPVGAIVVSGGEIIGEGCTQPPGGHHAERVALEMAGADARGGTLYTTLEPCCIQGRTPPCTDAIIQAGILRVNVSTIDPNPAVNGRGILQLEAAGIQVDLDHKESQYTELLAPYCKWVSTNLPFVTAKYAMSLDGKIATDQGESRWISGISSRKFTHKLRKESDAIMVGIGTVAKDNPRLTVRDAHGKPRNHQPLRIIIDSSGKLSPNTLLLHEPGKTLVATATISNNRHSLLNNFGVEVLVIPGENKRVNLVLLMEELGKRGILNILLEGGGILLSSMIQKQLIDKIIAFVSPIIIGGENSPTPVEGRSVTKLIQAPRLEKITTKKLGEDFLIMGYPSKRFI